MQKILNARLEFGLHPMDNGNSFMVSELEKEHVLKLAR